MTKRFTTLAAFVAALAILAPATAFANTVASQVTGFSPTLISVFDHGVEAARHRAEARAHRVSPNASESKRPGSPDTALHCDRIADRLEKAGK